MRLSIPYLLALLLLSFGLTACGGDALALDPVAEAATKTVDSGSSRFAGRTAIGVGAEQIRLTSEGAFDYANDRGRLVAQMAGVPGAGDGRIEVRYDGSVIYMKLPAGESGLPAGKSWLKVDIGRVAESEGIDLDSLRDQDDPAQMLQFLRAGSTKVTELGVATVRGVATTRYELVLDLQRVTEESLDALGLSEGEREEASREVERMAKELGTTSIPTTVDVDGEGLVRRMTMELSFRAEGKRVTMTTTSEFFDFGVPVSVSAPEARQVVDITEEALTGPPA
jgi:hypothetical protein